MENALVKYLNKRFIAEKNQMIKTEQGPVITISREVGCNGLNLAKEIEQRLNRQNWNAEWKVLSKEVFYESARELDLNPEKVRQIFKRTDKYMFDEILSAFNNRKFKSERIIIKTVVNVIRTFAVEGFSIIVGRAGHIIASDIRNALHIRLFAPIDFRVRSIMKNSQLSYNNALAFIQKVEQERKAFRKAIRASHAEEDYFDLHINRATFSDSVVVDLIERAIEKKVDLKKFGYKMEYY